MNFELLLRGYPAAFESFVSCTSAAEDQRWCGRCSKCFLYGVYSLFSGAVDSTFDYDTLFTRSGYARLCTAYAESGVELSRYGNAPWHDDICAAVVFGPL